MRTTAVLCDSNDLFLEQRLSRNSLAIVPNKTTGKEILITGASKDKTIKPENNLLFSNETTGSIFLPKVPTYSESKILHKSSFLLKEPQHILFMPFIKYYKKTSYKNDLIKGSCKTWFLFISNKS